MPQSIRVKSILTKTRRRDPWFLDDYTVNAWKGCSFNCLYCYIRGSKYGEHMEDKLTLKENVLEILERQLRRRALKKEQSIVVMSSATDPYLQFEKDLLVTRGMLELFLKYEFPVHVITKSPMVIRDLDLLKQIDQTALLPLDLKPRISHSAFITFSFSTTDDQIARIFEPGAPPPSERLKALKQCIDEGFHTGVSLMPLLPHITDTKAHLDEMFDIFSSIGVKYIFPATIILFGHDSSSSRLLMFRAVEKHYPHLTEKYKKFLEHNDQMPFYYREAFRRKMIEMCEVHHLKNSILQGLGSGH